MQHSREITEGGSERITHSTHIYAVSLALAFGFILSSSQHDKDAKEQLHTATHNAVNELREAKGSNKAAVKGG